MISYESRIGIWSSFVITLWAIFLIFSIPVYALEISVEPIEPDVAEQDTIQVDIYANSAVDLISMGLRISFDVAVLTVVRAYKNMDFTGGFILDADGDPGTTSDQYNNPPVDIDNASGSVTMIGGRLIGTSTTGLSGKVLLGSIIFKTVQIGSSNISVDLGKYHPDHPSKTFDNFVNLDGSVDEPANLGDVGAIHVLSDIDDDGLSDTYEENVTGTDPLLADTDGDGITDDAEDMDFDGMSNVEEYAAGTHPKEPNIYLFAGLNLIGYPVEVPEGYSSYDFLIDLGTEAEIERIQRYNPVTGTFETTTYEAGVAAGDEFDIVSGKGYYVYMKESKLMSFAGRIMTPGIGLEPGINLISIPSMPPDYTAYDLLLYLGAEDEAASIQRFNTETGAFETTAYFEGQASGVQFSILNGETYLVHMKVAKNIPSLLSAPAVAITSPGDRETVYSSSVEVSGTFSESSCYVTVNGIVATVSDGSFTAASVPLDLGANTITATAVSPNNLTGSHTINVNLE